MTPLYPIVTTKPDDIVIRQSTIGQMLKCPASWGYVHNKVEGVLPVFSEKVEFGSAGHKIVEHIINGANLYEVTQTDFMLDTTREVILEDGIDWLEYTTEKERSEFVEELKLYVHVWHKNFWKPYSPYIENTRSEVPVSIHIGDTDDGKRIVLHGTPDLACYYDQVPTLFDWKTAGRAWKENKPEYELQGPLYMALASSLMEVSFRKACFVVYDRSKGVLDELWTEREDIHVESAIRTAVEWGRQISANVFPPTPVVWEYQKPSRGWYCSPKYCQAWNVCDFKQLIPDGKYEQEVAVISWK